MMVSLSCRVYLCSINRMNHEIASQCSILSVIIDSVILAVYIKYSIIDKFLG